MVQSVYQAYREAYGGLSKEVWVLSVALFVNRCGSMVLAFLTLYMTSRLGFSMTEAGAVFSVYGLGSILGTYLGGRLIKPLGAIRVQIAGLLLSMPLFLLVPCFTSWAGVAFSIFILSAVSESVRPANNVAISQFTSPELQTRAYGLQRMALNLGLSVGPALGGILAEIDFVWLFIVDGVTTFLGGIFLLFHFGFRRYAKNGLAAERQRMSEENHAHGSPLRDLKFVGFLLLILLLGMVFFQIHATYPKYLEDHFGLTKPHIGFLYAVNTIIIVVFEMLLVNFVSRFSLLRTIGWGCFLACIGFGMLPAGTAVWFVVFSMIIITLGEMLTFPLATGFVAKRSIGRDQGMYMSWYAMTFSLAAVFAPILGGLAYGVDANLFWYISNLIGVVVLVGFYGLARSIQDHGMSVSIYPVEREPNDAAAMVTQVESGSTSSLGAE